MESIIIFIIFAIISSLFNKDKRTKKTYQRPRHSEANQMGTGGSQTSRRNLGELIKELTGDFNDVFNEKSLERKEAENDRRYIEEESFYSMNYEYDGYEEDQPSNQYQGYVDDKQQQMVYTRDKDQDLRKFIKEKTVYNDEIEDKVSNFPISFNEETLLQGIIMSEILGKPKALR